MKFQQKDILYSGRQIPVFLAFERSPEIKNLMGLLERSNKVLVGLYSKKCSKSKEHVHFRRTKKRVYSGSVRVYPRSLDKFTVWGFYDPNIFFVKSDYYPDINGLC